MSLAYERAADLGEALEALASGGTSVVPLAGGTDVMPDVRSGHIREGVLLDISRVGELRGVTVGSESVTVGGLVTAAELGRSPAVEAMLPPLAAAARSLGSPQVRNRATIGGNVVNASPAADLLLALVALEAEVLLASRRNERSLPLDGFFLAPGMTRRAPDELVVGFRVPIRAGSRAVFTKVGLRRALACALVNLCVVVVPDSGGRVCAQARIALGAVAPTCVRARRAEELLAGRAVDEELAAAAAAAPAAEIAPISDVRGSASYRRHLVRVHTQRALGELFPAADGGSQGAGQGGS